ncbi:glycosyltransferase family 4 protein [Bifidobacterium choloepi]
MVSPYSFETPGGVQNHIRDFAMELLKRGYHVSVFAPGRRTNDMPLWVQTNDSSFAIPYNGSWAHLSYFLTAGHRTRRWVRQGHFDILHLHEPETPSLSHKPLAMKDAPPMVATFHASIEPYPRALKLFQNYLLKYLSPLREAIYVSPAAGRTADHFLPDDMPRTTIPNGIDRSFFADAAVDPRWAGTADAPTIGFLGRMGEERKGFAVFAAAAPSILKRFPAARFLVAGDGEEDGRKMLRALDPSGLLESHFEFLGRISDEDKASFYRSLTLYVAPQTGGESFGIVLAEAMAAGCAVVASDLPAFVDVTKDGECAALFKTADAADCAVTTVNLLDDSVRREALAQAGFERSADFDWSTVVDRVLEVYARALS